MFEQRGELRVPAIEVRQSPGRLLHSFAVDGKQIPALRRFRESAGTARNSRAISDPRSCRTSRRFARISRAMPDGPECRGGGLRFTSRV